MAAKRSDAARNRDLILTAADETFTRHGVAAPLDLVAEAAGVGRATLYRNFEDRRALVLALLEQSIEALDKAALAVADNDDALFSLLRFSGEHITSRAWLFEQIGTLSPQEPAVRDARMRVRDLFQKPLAKAIAAGLCRPDLTTGDVLMVSAMVSGAIRGQPESTRSATGQRAVRYLIEGLKPPPC